MRRTFFIDITVPIEERDHAKNVGKSARNQTGRWKRNDCEEIFVAPQWMRHLPRDSEIGKNKPVSRLV